MEEQKYTYEFFPQMIPDLCLKGYLQDDGYEDLNKVLQDKSTEGELENIEHIKWSKFMLETIYKVWFQFFIIKVRNNMENENFARLTNYAIFLIEDMKNKNLTISELIFRYVLEACGYFRMDEKALFLVHEMKLLKIDTSPSTHSVYFLAIAKAMNQKGLPQKQVEEKFQQIEDHHQQFLINEDPQHHHSEQTLGQQGRLDKNLLPIDPFVNSRFKINYLCPVCHRQLCFEEILDGFKKNFYDNHTKCLVHGSVGCSKEFIAKFQQTVYEDDQPLDSQMFDLYSPLNIQKEIENFIKTKGDTYLLSDLFEKQNKDFFMNIILYMSIIKVPIFFFCSKVAEQYYEHNFQQMEQQMIKQMNKHKQNSFFTKIFKEFDIYKQELEKLGARQSLMREDRKEKKDQNNSSSGSAGSSTKQENSQKHTNHASKAIKKVFGELVKDFNETYERKSAVTSQRAINVQMVQMQFEESKQSTSPTKK